MFGDIVAAAVGSNAAGYERVADMKWVSAPTGGIRNLVEMQRMKGATFSGRWGFSVDFVPVRSGRKLAWKRSAGKARLDLCIDPIDTSGDIPDWCSFDEFSDPDRVAGAGVAVFEAALRDFSRVSTLQDLNALFLERSRMKFRRFALSNYVQTEICWGLVQIACNDEQNGLAQIEHFCQLFEIDQNSITLRRAVAEARQVASGG